MYVRYGMCVVVGGEDEDVEDKHDDEDEIASQSSK